MVSNLEVHPSFIFCIYNHIVNKLWIQLDITIIIHNNIDAHKEQTIVIIPRCHNVLDMTSC